MSEKLQQDLFKVYNVCVLIPTYNNHATLKRVIDGVLAYTQDVIIVNDGSIDTTSNILQAYQQLNIIHLPENKGKGNALRVGFKKALSLGYDYVITIDSDGQHYPDDLPVFLNSLDTSENKNLLLIGSRNMDQEGVPGKSSFGNKFSNFWFWFETGIKLKDTQSGYRLYPLKSLEKLKFFTTKFEFEIEVIVKAAWADVEVKNIPVKVKYDPNERVSHFRPFRDFTRISILNTYLVILTLFYIIPRNLFRRLKKKGIKRFFVEDVLGHNDSPRKKALSVALGVLIGMSPLWGFHTVIVLSTAVLLKLNKAIAFGFSNVSLPPFIPFIVFGGIKTGQFILGDNTALSIDDILSKNGALQHVKVYLIGSITLAIITALCFGLISYIVFSAMQKSKVPVANE